MKLAAIISIAAIVFVLAAVGLRRTVGGLVEQAGARETSTVNIDVQLSLGDRAGAPLTNVPVRLVAAPSPESQAPSTGQQVAIDATGMASFTMRGVMDKVPRKRPTDFIGSLMASPELTDHLGLGAELTYLTHRWLYVAQLYRFPDGDIVHDGLSLYTKGEDGRFSRRAEQDSSGGWRIADLDNVRMTTIGYDFTMNAFERIDETHWKLSIAFTRHPEPIER